MASGNSQEIITYKQSTMNAIASVENIRKGIYAKYENTDQLMEAGDLFYTHIFLLTCRKIQDGVHEEY